MKQWQSYYVKNVFYGNYVKETIFPLDLITGNVRNATGKKNMGENEKKLICSNIRSKTNFIRKTYHNFADCKKLTFLTLTYAVNATNVKNCKKDVAKFFKNIKYWFFTTKNKQIKYVYTYEYQMRGAVHFHILLDDYLPNELVLKHWNHGINKNLKVKANTQEHVAKYCSKYITAHYMSKNTTTSNCQNQFDLNIKSYQFSYNCENPKIQKWVTKMTLQQIIAKAAKAEFIKFMKKPTFDKKSTLLIGANYDFKLENYQNTYKKLLH